MKLFRGFAVLGVLALSSTSLFAKSAQISAPPPSGGESVCVGVYCNGVASGVACGRTTQELYDQAVSICSGGA
jgi:hypothetical protein